MQAASDQKQKETQGNSKQQEATVIAPVPEPSNALPLPTVEPIRKRDTATSDPSLIFGAGPSGSSGTNPVTVQNEPPPAPPVKPSTEQNAQTKPPAPISFGVLNRRAKSLPKPFYPEQAMSAGIQGLVQVQVVVDESGRVVSAGCASGNRSCPRRRPISGG